MVKNYLKVLFQQKNISYEEDRNSFIIDCGGNDSEFIKMISLINRYIETWTYDLELTLNIKIDTGYEKIVIEYWKEWSGWFGEEIYKNTMIM